MQRAAEHHLHRRRPVVRGLDALVEDLELAVRSIRVVPVALLEVREEQSALGVEVLPVVHLPGEVGPQPRLDEVGLGLQTAHVPHDGKVARELPVADEVALGHRQRRGGALLGVEGANLPGVRVDVVDVHGDLRDEPLASVVEAAGVGEPPRPRAAVEGRVPHACVSHVAAPVADLLDAVGHDRHGVVVEDARLGDRARLPHHAVVGLAGGGEDVVHRADEDAGVPNVGGLAALVRAHAVVDEASQPRKDIGGRHCWEHSRIAFPIPKPKNWSDREDVATTFEDDVSDDTRNNSITTSVLRHS